jgi:hypothetical protein
VNEGAWLTPWYDSVLLSFSIPGRYRILLSR